jgi:hypothetical protein
MCKILKREECSVSSTWLVPAQPNHLGYGPIPQSYTVFLFQTKKPVIKRDEIPSQVPMLKTMFEDTTYNKTMFEISALLANIHGVDKI